MGQSATMLSFMGFVVVFLLVAVFFTLSQLQWARRLRKNGTRVEAIVLRSEQGRTSRYYEKLFPRMSTARPPRRSVSVQWTDPYTQRTYTYRKRGYRGPAMNNGDSIQIVVDPRNPRRYRLQ